MLATGRYCTKCKELHFEKTRYCGACKKQSRDYTKKVRSDPIRYAKIRTRMRGYYQDNKKNILASKSKHYHGERLKEALRKDFESHRHIHEPEDNTKKYNRLVRALFKFNEKS
jgi:hypothetical protein